MTLLRRTNKLLWIGFVWPEPASSAAGVRALQLLDAFAGEGWEIHACSPCQDSSYREQLEARGVATARFEPNDSRFDVYVRELAPDAVIFDRFMIEEQFGWRVREQCPDALRVLDTIDLHSLRRARQQKAASNSKGEVTQEELMGPDLLRELSAIYRSDLSLVISDHELELLRDRLGVPSSLLELCGIHYPEPRPGLSYAQRRDFVIIGNYRHEPNLDAFRLLARGLWSEIRSRLKQRDSELHVYGAYPTQEIMELDNPRTGFRSKGWAPDAREVLARYRVNLAPLRFGAGIKGKVLDGWAAGTPCVATPVAAEALGQPFGGLVANLEGFAQAAAELYEDEALWERSRAAGMHTLQERFAQARVVPPLLARIRQLLGARRETRARNIVGAMLWHHGARSTEYFSRWIEAKNARRSDQAALAASPYHMPSSSSPSGSSK